MKKSLLLVIAVLTVLSSCGVTANMASSSDGQKFQDGIYGNVPSFKSKTELASSQKETDELIEKTKGSTIYLFGDKKDTVFIPKDMAAKISFDNEFGGTTVTVAEYDWGYDSPWNWYSPYTPYSIGSSWYWSRHYSPWYWNTWAYTPWHYSGWYSPWYTGWYDPWYYGGWYDPWYYGYGYAGWYGGFYGPYYCGWYGGWDPYWHHHHHHGYYPGHHHGHQPQYVDTWRGSRHQTGSDKLYAGRTTTVSYTHLTLPTNVNV